MRHTVERTNKPEIRPEEQSEKTESCRENVGRNTVERAIKTEIDTELKGVGKLSWFMSDINNNIPAL